MLFSGVNSGGQTALVLRGHPALKKEGVLRVQQAALGLLPGDLLRRTVRAAQQRLPPVAAGDDLRLDRLHLGVQRGHFAVQIPDVVLRRSRPVLKIGPGKAVGPHGLGAGALHAGVAHQQEVAQLPVGSGIGEGRHVRRGEHCPLHGGVIRPGRDGAEDHGNGPVSRHLQRHVQRQPRGQRRLLQLQLGPLGVETLDLPLACQ